MSKLGNVLTNWLQAWFEEKNEQKVRPLQEHVAC
jgi:hypothetical protein